MYQKPRGVKSEGIERIFWFGVVWAFLDCTFSHARDFGWRRDYGTPLPVSNLILDLEINQEPFQVNLGDVFAEFRQSDADPLKIDFGRKRFPSWHHMGITDFSAAASGADVDIRIYSVRWAGGGQIPRIGTDSTVNFNGDSENTERYEKIPHIFGGTMAAQMTQLGAHHRLLREFSGPSVGIDVVLFDKIVGGNPFEIRATRLSFVDWRPKELRFSNIPEPTALIQLACALVTLCWLIPIRRRGKAH